MERACVRDYVHVEDLVDAHFAVMKTLKPSTSPRLHCYNLGIGKGHSVREIVASVERISGRGVPLSEGPRRAGDPPELFADPGLIRREIGWSAQITDLDEIVGSAWSWMNARPRGYASDQQESAAPGAPATGSRRTIRV